MNPSKVNASSFPSSFSLFSQLHRGFQVFIFRFFCCCFYGSSCSNLLHRIEKMNQVLLLARFCKPTVWTLQCQ